jgi:uncharacterized SAM-binding protein YcdF (DUF218 family)
MEAYEDGVAPVVLCSGGKRWPGGLEATVMWRHFVDRGIPRDRVFAELLSQNTFQNAVFSSHIARIMGWHCLAIVSCAWHLPRALADFRAVGMTDLIPVAVPTPPRGTLERAITFTSERVSRSLDVVRYLGRSVA